MGDQDVSEIVKVVLNEFGLRDAETERIGSGVHTNVKVCTDSGRFFLKILTGNCAETRASRADAGTLRKRVRSAGDQLRPDCRDVRTVSRRLHP